MSTSNGNFEWQIRAMGNIEKNIAIHEIEKEELIEQGMITIPFANSNKYTITPLGRSILDRSRSPDYASKRY
jgi:predicted transcriptional regulator